MTFKRVSNVIKRSLHQSKALQLSSRTGPGPRYKGVTSQASQVSGSTKPSISGASSQTTSPLGSAKNLHRYPCAFPFRAPLSVRPRSVPIDHKSFNLDAHQVFAIQPNFRTKCFSAKSVFVLTNKPPAFHPRAQRIELARQKHVSETPTPKFLPKQNRPTRESMTSHIDIVSTPTADTSGSCLYVHFDKRRYVFGRLAEGTQRVLGQRKYAMSSLEQLFVTGEMSWKTLGGMMGMIMTISDVINTSRDAMQLDNQDRISKGRAPLKIDLPERLHMHGADNLSYIMATARSFIFRTGIPFKTIELYEDLRLENPTLSKPDWEDDCLRVWKLPIYPKSNKRRHDGTPASPDPSTETPEAKAQRNRDRDALLAVVENMFNSSWRMDKLEPTMLHDVVMPAKIFIKDQDGIIRLYTGPKPSMDGNNSDVPNVEVLVRSPWPATMVGVLPAPLATGQSLCYIAKNHQRRGKFNPAAAKALGVPPKLNGKLTAGQSIEVKNVTVTPEMVMDPPIPGQGFVVADIPDRSYLESFFARPEWANLEIMSDVGIFYWILSEELVSDPNVLRFMRENSHIKHIVCSPDTSPNMMAFESYGTILTALHRLDPDRYPILKFDNAMPEVKASGDIPFVAGRVGMRMQTMPKREEKPANVLPFPDLMSLVNKLDPEILKMADEARELVNKPEFKARVEESEKDIPNRDTEIITLGTGSAVPSKYRNVSATLIRVPGVGSYLLDCGENTLGQIRRLYGKAEARKIIADLKFLFISHLHADHHLGTITVVEEWIDATQHLTPAPKLTIGCTRFMKTFLDEYCNARNLDLSNIIFSGLHIGDNDFKEVFPADHPSGLATAHYVNVNHCKDAHAGVFTWPSGLKISYSGDCRPSPRFARMGRDSTLLIHECTFESDKQGDAINKRHSTMAEALDIASMMRARRVMLTHFSQRYAKLPAQQRDEITEQDLEGLDEQEKQRRLLDKQRVVLMGCDQMTVKLGEFQQAAEFLPAVLQFLQTEEKD
ncbi:metallo-beta-lactamase superfamily protein [Ceratocystis lukuohia]|uniref:ribonuclease Z n=1 Tax=Ceratocystis lukuohia TaxID=2019550 RepID=A0ABR4MDU5_9PEZI